MPTIRTDDASLQQAYAQLEQARRLRSTTRDDVAVETVQSLAAGTYIGADREALIDRVLSDPFLANEFRLFMDIERARPAGTARRIPWQRLLLAASTLGAVALGTVLLRPAPEPLRGGDEAGVISVEPSPALPGSMATLTWRSVPNAAEYDIEVYEVGGNVVTSGQTADTTFAIRVPDATQGSLSWRVSARLPDGTVQRSATTPLPVRLP